MLIRTKLDLDARGLIVLLAIVFLSYYTYQTVTASSVTVNFSPRMQVVSQLFTITASPTIQTPDVSTRSIPTRAFSSKDQASLTGPTTGRVECGFFGVFACKQGVSQVDVDGLVNQMQSSLESRITQGLQKQVEAVKNCRNISKKDLLHNDQTPPIEVNPENYEVKVNGQLITCAPATEVALAQRYFLF